ncbi:MAG: Reverse gyrase [Methanomassiliicoccales archaeon PtaB.Bin215]|nr:MAG: Reverse gyrase [Methanomassiliicoccales archaeon PtaB.Bin215]
MKRLVISEKSNAAARVATILSDGGAKRKSVRGVQVFNFERNGDEFYVVGLRGHIIELDYPPEFNDWSKVDPKDLVKTHPAKRVTALNILHTLSELASECDEVIIATDFDREGELIGLETVSLLEKPPRSVRRVRFSALTKYEIEGAFKQLTDPDHRLAESAETRQVIDLAWGAVLTRFISLASGQMGNNFLSVGRVQSPTLTLIVDRHKEIIEFVPEPYWTVVARLEKGQEFSGDHIANPFKDEAKAEAVRKRADCGKGRVMGMERKEKDEYPPAPFNTTTMLSEANKLGLSPSLAMKVAEDLYTAGYISYPRTDNTVYPRSLGLKNILEKLKKSDLGKEAAEILGQETIRPSRGRVETTDHPPIYPTEAATKKELKGAKWTLYELVVRRFLATLAPSARSESARCDLELGGEPFRAEGYRILSPGWRKYYPYWRVSEVLLPELITGDMVDIKEVRNDRKETRPPSRYSQGSLLQEMERLGLGTKSTRHDIIQKLYDRKYVNGNDLVPTLSGLAVVNALEKHAKIVTESRMTAQLEKDMDAIANGDSSLVEVVQESQAMLLDIVEVMTKQRKEIGDEIRNALQEQRFIGTCPKCGKDLRIVRSRKGSEFIGCSGYPECDVTYPKPGGALVQPSEEKCEVCGLPKVKVIRRGSPVKLQCIDPDCQSNQGKESAGTCPECGKELRVLYSRAGKRFIGCSGYPECKRTYPLPQFGTLQFLGEKCPECGAPTLKVLGRGGWQFCANMECPTSKKAKKEGEAKKTVKKTAKKPAKKAEEEGTETGATAKKTVKKTVKKPAKKPAKKAEEEGTETGPTAKKAVKKTVKKTAKKAAAKPKKKVSPAE